MDTRDNDIFENKELQKIILNIEKVNSELDYLAASINSNIWNLENPDAELKMREEFLEELIKDLNNQEMLRDKRENLIYDKLAEKIVKLKMNMKPQELLESINAVKRKHKIDNLFTDPRVRKLS